NLFKQIYKQVLNSYQEWVATNEKSRRAGQMASELRDAFAKESKDWESGGLETRLAAAMDLQKEPPVAGALQTIADELTIKIAAAAAVADWLAVLHICSTARKMLKSLPPGPSRQLSETIDRSEQEAQPFLQEKKKNLERLYREKRWKELETETQLYLQVCQNEPEVQKWFELAHRYA